MRNINNFTNKKNNNKKKSKKKKRLEDVAREELF